MYFTDRELELITQARVQNIPRANLYFSLYLYTLGLDFKEFIRKDLKQIRTYISVTGEGIEEILKREEYKQTPFIFISSGIKDPEYGENMAIEGYLKAKALDLKFFHYYSEKLNQFVYALEVDANVKKNFMLGRYSKMYPPITVNQFFSKEKEEELYRYDYNVIGPEVAVKRRFLRKRLYYVFNNAPAFRQLIGYTSKVGEADDIPTISDETLHL